MQLQGEATAAAIEDEGSATIMGATLAEPDKDLLKKLGLKGGVEVVSVEKGNFSAAGVRKGLVITHINQIQVSTVKEALEVIKNARRGFLVEGMYRNGDVYYYGVGV